jgi:hypothetical protein
MSLPDLFETTRQQIDPTGSLSALGGAPPSGTTLTFSMQNQNHTEWCWAAVSVSISHFYNSVSSWTQCDVVDAEFSLSNCCSNGSSSQCNQPWYLDKALTRTSNLNVMSTEVTSYQDLNTEIENGYPLCCRIGWNGGGGHFVALHGYLNKSVGSSIENWVDVGDPWYGPSSLLYDDFRTKYQNTGKWTHSYTTKA